MFKVLRYQWIGFIGFAVLLSSLTGCQNQMDKYIDSYMERKGPEVIEGVIDKIVQKRREEAGKARKEPSIEEKLKQRHQVDISGIPMKGSGELVIVEFSDFQCPFCKRVLPTVEKVMSEYRGKVKLGFRHNPLPFHPKAMPAAKAAWAAHKQGKFWEMHDKMFENQLKLGDENFTAWAKELKLDMAKFNKDMKDPKIEEIIKKDAEFARNNKAGGTPSFFIGRKKGDKVDAVLLVGAQPYPKFKELIDALLKEKS